MIFPDIQVYNINNRTRKEEVALRHLRYLFYVCIYIYCTSLMTDMKPASVMPSGTQLR